MSVDISNFCSKVQEGFNKKMKNSVAVVLFAVLAVRGSFGQVGDPYKSLVTYLGTDFIMPDGCPPPKCDTNLRDCRKEMLDQEKAYNDCLA